MRRFQAEGDTHATDTLREEVERYTRAARQSKLADVAMKKLRPGADTVPAD